MQLAENTAVSLSFEEVKALADADMQAVDECIRESLTSDVALGYTGSQQIRAAAIVEFIHTATLLHDDVVDSSARRRGKDTANTVFGNQASVLVGDFLYSRAFQMMVDIGRMRVMQILADATRVMQILADATNTIAAGEVMQLMNMHDPDVNEASYRKVIYRKTARLFEAGAQIAAVLADRDPADEAAMVCYGQNLGTAFQLIDDALDYDATPEELGKNLGDDLAEGKPTLPLIYAMENCSDSERKMIRGAIEAGGLDKMDEIHDVIEATGALQYTTARAQEAADVAINALSGIPDSDYKQAMIAIAEFAVSRRS
jgi:octaprenyl-diphosphate synthase